MKDPVVASLPGSELSHPYSSIATSPDRSHAIVAGKDTLRVCSISALGLSELHSIRVAKYFRAPSSNALNLHSANSTNNPSRYTFDLRNFQHGSHNDGSQTQGTTATGDASGMNVTITDVAWSHAKINREFSSSTESNTSGGVGNNHNMGSSIKNDVGIGNISANIANTNAANTNKSGVDFDASSLHDMNEPNPNSNHTYGSNSSNPLLNHFSQQMNMEDDPNNMNSNINLFSSLAEDSVVAAAGSNGVVVAWHARTALLEDISGSTRSGQTPPAILGQPEAVLAEHTRAVNRLAWHSRKHDLLLSASQDATVKLWDRRASGATSKTIQAPKNAFESWFGFNVGSKAQTWNSHPRRSIPSWHCASTFQPKCEGVRDIKWSPYIDEAFAIVTNNGILAVYDMRLTARPWIKIPAHAGEATSVDWHPTRRYTIATGGGRDRSVKIWDVQTGLSTESGDFQRSNSATNRSCESADSDKQPYSSQHGANSQSMSSLPPASLSLRHNQNTTNSSSGPSNTTFRSNSKGSQVVKRLHILSISAPITRLEWRPPNNANVFLHSPSEDFIDHHDAMLAVATAPISATNYGGAGSIELWSYHRPFMALSIVEGHQDGAVTDFVWLDIPSPIKNRRRKSGDSWGLGGGGGSSVGGGSDLSESPNLNPNMNLNLEDGLTDITSILDNPNSRVKMMFDNPNNLNTRSERSSSFSGSSVVNRDNFLDDLFIIKGTWQHVLSVGRDGRCLLQNLERGKRPISQVPRSTFAIANLSPFQSGSGSLQIMSIHQNVPSGQQNDFALTRLRRDAGTARAPGVYAEVPEILEGVTNRNLWRPKRGGQREPAQNPKLVFSVIDPGDLDEPVSDRNNSFVAPELVHVSRFAKSYRLHRDSDFPTHASICLHNSDIAERWFGFGSLARMWKLLASILEGASFDNSKRTTKENNRATENVMNFLLLPTIRKLLLERADAGDVQTCVAICEIVGVFLPQNEREKSSNAADATSIPDLPAELVREWYLAYIDILQQMCLFSQASELIRTCQDSQIAALNQQSTTIHMSCPSCGKPIESTTEKGGRNNSLLPVAPRACRSCRKRIAMCFVCHTPVKGVYVYCPGCGHGGHLEHALEWFALHEECPTGCGHKCNKLREISAFPKTKSLICNIADDY